MEGRRNEYGARGISKKQVFVKTCHKCGRIIELCVENKVSCSDFILQQEIKKEKQKPFETEVSMLVRKAGENRKILKLSQLN